MKRSIMSLAAGVALGWMPACLADTVFLKNGDEVQGTIVEEADNAIVIKDSNGALRSIGRNRIDVIVYDRKPAPQALVAKPPEPPPEVKSEAPAGESKEAPPEGKTDGGTAAEGKTGEVPAGESKTGEPQTAESKTGEVKTDEAKTGEKKEGKEGEKTAGDGKKEEKPPKKNRPDYTEDEKKHIAELMDKMDTDDPNQRGLAKAELAKMGPRVVAALVDGLQHKRVEARAACATLLGELNARNSVKQQIEVFFSAMPDRGEAATYQVIFIRALKVSLAATTGQSFINVEPDKPMIQDGLKKYIDWYNANFDRLPPQIDEEEIEPTDPEYMQKLTKQRALKLEKKQWPRPALSVEKAMGKENPPPTRPQDLEYEKAFPKTDREKAGGYIRENDKKFGEDFFRKPNQ